MINQEQCWEAVERHDGNFDGEFFFGVMTTGVYCRPSCPSRRPLRQNVRFYATAAEAERDGLRACKRCRPLDPERDRATAKVRELCRHIEAHPDEAPGLAELAARAGFSRFHFQRSFKAVAGVTPKQYVEACRIRKLKGSLRESKDVTEAVYDAGFGSSSRVYERADTRLGMTPMQYRRGGQGVAITYATAATAARPVDDRGHRPRDLLRAIRRFGGGVVGGAAARISGGADRRHGDAASAGVREVDGGADEAPGRQPAAPRPAARHSRDGVPDARLELSPVDSLWRSAVVWRSGGGNRQAVRRAGGGARMRVEHGRAGDSVPSRDSRDR